ncbi:amino acid ABC transporter permease [Actinomadura terrae]|uniref:amino acid ABC transporter permease n=1 Tax=Actinomadura terrae TaxID=604353 RepID=UPI001FA73EA5|nr:amino acid ABC transporter permease [Actinomadura terrae]
MGAGGHESLLDRLDTLTIVPRRAVLARWVPGVVLAALAGWLVATVARSPNLNWGVVGDYLFAEPIMRGVGVTLVLTAATMVAGLLIGGVLALMRQSRNPVAVAVSAAYVWFFRGTPLLVQLVFWFNLALLFPRLGVGLPGTGLGWTAETNHVITPFVAALCGLALHEAAYMAEIIRGGFLAVPQGQIDAALTIGMTRGQAVRKIAVPQAVQVILPPLGNQFILILKGTSMVSVIGGGDLLTRSQQIYGMNYQVIALLMVASIWYLVLVSISSVGQYFLERAVRGQSQGGLLRRVARNAFGGRR